MIRDTTLVDPPTDHFYASALWLLGRHPKLVRLVERVPGALSQQHDGPWLELDVLADALEALDAHRAAWADYERRNPTWGSWDDVDYEAWERRGPQHTHPASRAIGVMSRTEVSRLRLLAWFDRPGRLGQADLSGFDEDGQALIRDWTRAVLAA